MEFNTPQSLNGAQLKDELKAQGIIVEKIDNNATGQISFVVDKAKEGLAASVVAAHVGVDSVQTIADKLASVGLSIDELKAALSE